MEQDQTQSNEEKSAAILKEVFQETSDKPEDPQVSTEEAADQIKGSDADADHPLADDDQPKADEAAEEIKGSDADKD